MSGLRLKTSIGIDSCSEPVHRSTATRPARQPRLAQTKWSCRRHARKAFGTNAMPTWIKGLQALKCSNTSPLITLAGGEFIY